MELLLPLVGWGQTGFEIIFKLLNIIADKAREQNQSNSISTKENVVLVHNTFLELYIKTSLLQSPKPLKKMLTYFKKC